MEAGSGSHKSGGLAWAKLSGRPWWPCVVFSSWEELEAWKLPDEIDEKPAINAQQVICFFLGNYNYQVFEKAAIRDWEHADFRQTVATATESSAKAGDMLWRDASVEATVTND